MSEALASSTQIRAVTELDDAMLEDLVDLLMAVVAEGASVGFLPPVSRDEAIAYWETVPGPGVVLLVAEQEDRIVGSVQLHCAQRANASHRAEVAKLMVHPGVRRQGLGLRLMAAVEVEALERDRTLLVLDTREGDPANDLYQALGYVEAGRIPRYARSATGELAGTVIYYKEL